MLIFSDLIIFDLYDKDMLDNNASTITATIDFLNLIDSIFANWFSAISKLNILNDSDSIKSLLSV